MKTVSLELAKQLKEKGFPQFPSEFYWWGNKAETEIKLAHKSEIFEHIVELGIRTKGYCAAPTAEEILEGLPWMIEKKITKTSLHYYMLMDKMVDGGGYAVEYQTQNLTIEVVLRAENREEERWLHREEAETLAEAAGKMYIYLSDNNLLPKGEME